MGRIGVHELWRQGSGILRRMAGVAVKVTGRSRPPDHLMNTMPNGLAQLEREGLLRRAQGDVLDLQPIALRTGAMAPSSAVSGDRAD